MVRHGSTQDDLKSPVAIRYHIGTWRCAYLFNLRLCGNGPAWSDMIRHKAIWNCRYDMEWCWIGIHMNWICWHHSGMRYKSYVLLGLSEWSDMVRHKTNWTCARNYDFLLNNLNMILTRWNGFAIDECWLWHFGMAWASLGIMLAFVYGLHLFMVLEWVGVFWHGPARSDTKWYAIAVAIGNGVELM